VVVGVTWKDDYREDKQETGLTWDQYHERRFIHVDDLDSATATLADLSTQVEALTNEYKELRRELQEVRILMESDEFDP
jgi:flagellar biosynthesis chaperone FliJ